MGQWKLPETKDDLQQLRILNKKLKLLIHEFNGVIGDDILWDTLYGAHDRVKYFLKSSYVKRTLKDKLS